MQAFLYCMQAAVCGYALELWGNHPRTGWQAPSNAVSFACMAGVLLNAARFDGRSCINSPLPSDV